MKEDGHSDSLVRERLMRAAEERLRDAPTLPAIMEIVRTMARAIFDADGVTFVLRDGNFCHYAEEEAVSPLWKGQRFPAETCVSGWCMIHGESAVIDDIDVDPRVPKDLYRRTFVRSLIMAPAGRDTPVAAIGAYWARRRCHPSEDIAAVERLARAVGAALRRTEAA